MKTLVIVLMITMIGAVITITGLLVTRMPKSATPVLPAQLQLPQGATALAFTTGPGWFAVTTTDNRILIYTPQGELAQQITVTLP